MKTAVRLWAFAALSLACWAQTATVNGVVTDTTSAVIVGARLQITNLDTGLRQETQSSDAGTFTFKLLPVGRYKVEASKAGFGTSDVPEVKLDVDQVARIDFQLKPGAVVETVQVTAAAALLDSETS